VIRRGLDAVRGKFVGQLLRRLARLTVDDARLPFPRANEIQDLFIRTRLGRDAIGEVRAIEARDVATRVVQMKLLNDVRAHALGGRGGQRHERHARKIFAQRRELPILRTEVVAPLADAMRLINRKRRDVPILQVFEKARHQQPLRRDVEQAELAIVQSAQPGPRLARRERGVEECCRHACRLQRVHLVLHQRDQRRNDYGEPGPHQRRKLKAKRLAPSRRQHGKNVFARQRIADDVLLQRAERTEAKVLLQRLEKLSRRNGHGGMLPKTICLVSPEKKIARRAPKDSQFMRLVERWLSGLRHTPGKRA
jgi:hypothetical protein